MIRSPFALALPAVLVHALALPAAARQAEPDLGETIVTAARAERSTLETPYAVDVVDREDLARRSYRTTPQALRDVPGVMVQETAHGQGSPYLRGLTGYLNVLLVDGIRLNNSVFRAGPNQYWNTVDPYSLARLEVVKGPSSVLYGSDAIGGTVQAFTKDVPDGRLGLAFGRGSTAERSLVGRLETGALLGEDWAFRLGGTTKHYGDLVAGGGTGTQENTGYDEWDADLKLEHRLDDERRLVFAYQQVFQDDVPRTHRTVFAESFEGTTIGSDLRRDLDQERRLTYVQYHDLSGGLFDELHASLSWHEQEERRDRVRGSGARQLQGFYVGTLGVLASAVGPPTELGRFTAGFDYYRDHVSSFSSTEPIQGPVGDEASYDLLGVYVQDELEVDERLTLTLGARANWAAADAERVVDPVGGGPIDVEDEWSRLVGSVRFLYRLREEAVHLFGGVSQGFRAPNLSDLTRFDSARTDEFEVPATDLDPEDYVSFELGCRTRSERASSELALFYTDVSDQIVRVPTGNTNADGEAEITKDNVGDGYVYGVEAAGAVRLGPTWTLFANAAWLEGYVETFPTSSPVAVEEVLDRLPPLTAQVGLGWEALDGDTWAEVVLRHADDADRLSTRDRSDTSRIPPLGTPDHLLLDVRGGWEVSRHVRLDVALENLFDTDHRVHGSGQNGPGLNLIVGLTVSL